MDLVARTITATPLVGRADEVADLMAAVDDAAAGRPGAVLVEGDAGVGKTRLVGEFAHRVSAGGGHVLVGHCVDLGDAGVPYLPFAEALSQLLAEDPTAHPALSRWLLGTASEGGDSSVGQLQLFDAVLAALEPPVGTAGPTVLVLEDLHWADRSSRDLLAFLVRRLRDQRLLVVATVRSDDLHRRHPLRPLLAELGRLPVVERLQVAPFTQAEMTDYVRQLTGREPGPGRVDDVLVRSEGNAYFAEQLLACSGDGCDDQLPGVLADLLLSRVEALPPTARQVVRAAAVAGGRVDHDLLVQATGLSGDQIEEALRESVAPNVLAVAGDGYTFRHALAREAVYGDLLPGERVRLHGTFARLLAERGPGARGHAAELAHHRMASHDVPGALTASLQAADEALRLLAPAEALQHLERALQLWDAVGSPERLTGRTAASVTLSAATAASRAGLPTRSAALAGEAVARADAAESATEAVAARRALALALLADDRDAEALDAAEEALAVATRHPGGAAPRDVAWAGAAAARALMFRGRLDEARERAEGALATVRSAGHLDVEADLLVTLAAVTNNEGDTQRATELLELAMGLARSSGGLAVELRVAYNLSVAAYESGDLAGATRGVDAAVRRAEETGLSWSEYGLELRVLQVLVRYAAGDLAGSRRLAELAGRRPSDAVLARLTAVSLLAAVARGDDDAAATVRRLDDAWAHDGQIAMVAGGAGAEQALWEGDPAAALATVERAVEHVSRVWQQWFMGGIWLSAVGLAAAGDLAEQARLARDTGAERSAREDGARLLDRARLTAERGQPRGARMGPEGHAWLVRAEAEWSRVTGTPDPTVWRRAVTAFGEATRGLPDDADAYEVARCRWRLAEALLVTGDREGAAQAARSASTTAERLGARPLLHAVAGLVSRGRLDTVDPELPHDRVASSSLLTARETQVLALLADGLTNRQAGTRLFVSEKTVSVHVSNLMAKLGARSRTEAVAIAARRGLLAAQQSPA